MAGCSQNINTTSFGSVVPDDSTDLPHFQDEGNDRDDAQSGEIEDEDNVLDLPGPHTGVIRHQDQVLPIANVTRLMKKSIPTNGKISMESKVCVQECVSEFISFVTSEAAERCLKEKRKTINGEDLLFAMSELGFDNYIEPLKIFLKKYRDVSKGNNVPPPPIAPIHANANDTEVAGAGLMTTAANNVVVNQASSASGNPSDESCPAAATDLTT